MIITTTHEIEINVPQLARALRTLLKDKYPLLNTNDDKNMLLIVEQLYKAYQVYARQQETLENTNKKS